MKCPKCGYLGFEPVDRCRNCGYEFSLASPAAADLELPLRSATSGGPASSPAAGASTPADLPLFGAPIMADTPLTADTPLADDTPLITKASPPRPPLAVRRATPDVPRLRTMAPRAATLDLGLEVPPHEPARATPAQPVRTTPAQPVRATPAQLARAGSVDSSAPDHSVDAAEDATLGARLIAVILDAAILGAIDVIVIYFTLQICGVGLDEWRVLPWAPLAAFFVLQNGGYLVGFTAGGQTLGKMAAGIKVISAESASPVDVGRAFVRELTWVALAVPAGLGLLSTVFSPDRRGLHDRFAGTRVVRVTS